MSADECAQCGLPDLHDGDGDGIGSCDCVRCDECDAPTLACRCADDGYDDPYQWRPTDVSDLPEADRYYPVVVEETRRSVLWIQASNPDEAVHTFEDDPSDPPHGGMLVFDWAASSPDQVDWRYIERGGAWWPGTQADAHVQVWRDEQWRRQVDVETIAPVGGVL